MSESRLEVGRAEDVRDVLLQALADFQERLRQDAPEHESASKEI